MEKNQQPNNNEQNVNANTNQTQLEKIDSEAVSPVKLFKELMEQDISDEDLKTQLLKAGIEESVIKELLDTWKKVDAFMNQSVNFEKTAKEQTKKYFKEHEKFEVPEKAKSKFEIDPNTGKMMKVKEKGERE